LSSIQKLFQGQKRVETPLDEKYSLKLTQLVKFEKDLTALTDQLMLIIENYR